MTKTFAFVFARGGSKGLPGKNIQSLAKKPLINYSIEAANQSYLIEQVFVSTDCEKISSVAKDAGALLIERPIELATDDSPEWLAWKHAVDWVEERFGAFDEFVSLPATSPLRSQDDIHRAIHKWRNHSADICVTVTESYRNPYFNMLAQDEMGNFSRVISPRQVISRRQDAPRVFDMTTVAYVTSPRVVSDKNNLFECSLTAIEIPKQRAVDIDDIYDLLYAETLLRESLA